MSTLRIHLLIFVAEEQESAVDRAEVGRDVEYSELPVVTADKLQIDLVQHALVQAGTGPATRYWRRSGSDGGGNGSPNRRRVDGGSPEIR